MYCKILLKRNVASCVPLTIDFFFFLQDVTRGSFSGEDAGGGCDFSFLGVALGVEVWTGLTCCWPVWPTGGRGWTTLRGGSELSSCWTRAEEEVSGGSGGPSLWLLVLLDNTSIVAWMILLDGKHSKLHKPSLFFYNFHRDSSERCFWFSLTSSQALEISNRNTDPKEHMHFKFWGFGAGVTRDCILLRVAAAIFLRKVCHHHITITSTVSRTTSLPIFTLLFFHDLLLFGCLFHCCVLYSLSYKKLSTSSIECRSQYVVSREDRLSEVERQTDTLDTLGPCEEEYVEEGKEAENGKWNGKFCLLEKLLWFLADFSWCSCLRLQVIVDCWKGLQL